MKINIPQKYQPLLWLIFISTIIRIIIANWIELGNDEVYYHTYALYPDWSHFDHPPMVGWFIELFSFGNFLHSGFFMRISSIFFAAINTWLIFELGGKLKDEKTGWYAALLYTSSLYTSVIVGVFIMPDTPQVFFWVLSLYLMIDILPDKAISKPNSFKFLLLGFVIGLGMISKYTSVFLWLGIFLYLIFYNRNWFKTLSLYASGLISLIVFFPVLIWNYQHHFISFTFHGDRVELGAESIRFDLIGTEILGEFLYQNPIVFILVWMAVIYGLRKPKQILENQKFRLLIFQSVPMIAIFLFVALFRRTLPHWTGPAYISLIMIGAAYISKRNEENTIKFPPFIKASLISILFIITLGFAQINYGIIDLKKWITNDITLDLYGWKQMETPFKSIKENAEKKGIIEKDAPIISERWFPAANLDYYVALPNNTHVLAWGSLERIHKYAWMNQERGGYKKGMDAWYLNLDNDLFSMDFANHYFKQVIPVDTISISRSNKIVKKAYVYVLKDLKKLPYDDFQAFMKKNEEKKAKSAIE